MTNILSCRKAYIVTAMLALLAVAVPAGASAQSQAEQIAAATVAKQGSTAPDFSVEMLDGKTVKLSALKGKVVLVNFWATWCPPCREELKHVQKQIIDRFKDKPFVFLPISRGEKAATVEAFMQKSGYTFPVGLDPKQEVFKLYATNFIPRNFLIGKDGKVKYVSVGYSPEDFEKLIAAIEQELK